MIRTLTVLALFTAPALSAQTVPSWAAPIEAEQDQHMRDDPPPPPIRPPAVPIDGGLALLALAGTGLAARRLRTAE